MPGTATRETLGQVRSHELCQSCQVLGVEPPIMRDSGWGDSPAQYHPEAFVQAPPEHVVERLVAEIRRFKPQVLLTFEPGGLSGHKDHIAISQYTTSACAQAGDAQAFTAQIQAGLSLYRPPRLFYAARPQGFRLARVLRFRQAGSELPLPPPELQQ
jgi:LmbE family N-acetylglucosaminyl deacetylase